MNLDEFRKLNKCQRLYCSFSILGDGVLHSFWKDTVANGLYHHSMYLGKDGSLTEKVVKIGQRIWERCYRDYVRLVSTVNGDTLELAEHRKKLAERKGEKRFWAAVNKAVRCMAGDKRVKAAVCGLRRAYSPDL